MDSEPSGPATYFAPAERAESWNLARIAESIIADPVMQTVLQATGGLLMVLNKHRQVLAGNRELLDALGLKSGEPIIGLRPGEALGCIHAQAGPGGCGTSTRCQHCGAVLAILSAQAMQQTSTGECTLAHRREDRVVCSQYQVKITPLPFGQETVLVCVLHDITGMHRREFLEMVFLHDTRNLLAGLQGWAAQMREETPSEAARNVGRLAEEIIREIESHDMLLRAESGFLHARSHPVSVNRIFDEIETFFRNHPCRRDKALRIDRVADSETLNTDKALLLRVLTNMVINALEASPAKSEIRVWFERSGLHPSFHVHNPGTIPPSLAAHIFQPHFSSKGRGRGFGTYAMRLLGENCLGGRVGFTSDVVAGTRFFIELP